MKQRRRTITPRPAPADRLAAKARKQQNLHPETNPRHADTFQQARRLQDLGMTAQQTQAGWTDQPAADYTEAVLEWVFARMGDPKVNGYACDTCGQAVVTIDKHPGVTPAFVSHGQFGVECEGTTTSSWYRVRQELGVYATHEWYRPSADELLDYHALAAGPTPVGHAAASEWAMAGGTVDHVMRGGLLLRKIPDGSDTIVEALARGKVPEPPALQVAARHLLAVDDDA